MNARAANFVRTHAPEFRGARASCRGGGVRDKWRLGPWASRAGEGVPPARTSRSVRNTRRDRSPCGSHQRRFVSAGRRNRHGSPTDQPPLVPYAAASARRARSPECIVALPQNRWRVFPLVPKFHLGTPISPKLRFARASRRRSETSRTSRSQAQLGNEAASSPGAPCNSARFSAATTV